ncbi:MAG: hypothetical protein JO209_09615 [Acidisphaera sp.]|nr:hypothetical protein [Acidisphaera sp.]
MESRVAVLETIARNTESALAEIRSELRGMRTSIDAELRDIRAAQARDFRWMLAAFAALLGVMAHGFHWF